MKYSALDPQLFVTHRANLTRLLLPNSLAIVNANDILPTNADGSFLLRPNSDLFYLSGVEQEETMLLLYPDAHDEKFREILFLRAPSPLAETWEGHKLTKEEARRNFRRRAGGMAFGIPRDFSPAHVRVQPCLPQLQ